jgi:DNA-binding NtrC family response regulator
MLSVLIVDDEPEMCSSLAEVLGSYGFAADSIDDPTRVADWVAHRTVDVVLLDIKMPRRSGFDVLSQLRETGWHGQVLVVSGYGSVENVVHAMKIGAANFYQKPVRIGRLVSELRQLEQACGGAGRKEVAGAELASHNPKMQRTIAEARRAAPTDAAVVLNGETGTGKELIARDIVAHSGRAEMPFLRVNCAAVPDTLLESELFGHEAGAFTDAKRQHRGKFDQADGGTLFFDEVGDMSLTTQAKLLRVLQDGCFERLGGAETISTDVRIIAATNKNLEELIEQGGFRDDLYYRLTVVQLELPPLRERPEDIVPLSQSFLGHFARKYGKNIHGISEEVQSLFIGHSWPGNVRELQNVVERAVIFTDAREIRLSDLPAQYAPTAEPVGGKRYKHAQAAVSRQVIMEALEKSNGVKREAARLLNMHRKTLYNNMKKLGIES